MKSEMSRRDFLKLSGAVGATVAAASVLGGCSSGAETKESGTAIKEILGHAGSANIVVYDPGTKDKRSKICIVMMYGSSRSTDKLQNDGMKRLAAYGYRAANCAPRNGFFMDQVKWLSKCIEWIKENIEGVEKIVLWGNSRGCNVTSAYQRIAENGAVTFQGPGMIRPIPDMELLPADGIIHCDANFGFVINHIASLATNMVDDDSVMELTSPELDPLAKENGYQEGGAANYTDEFARKIWKAQAQRYNRLLAKAQKRMELVEAGKGMFSDDEPFTVVMGFGNVNAYQLYSHDTRFFSRTKEPHKLVHKDGSVTTEIVPTVRSGEKDPGKFTTLDKGYQTKISEYLWCGMKVDEDQFGYDESEIYGVEIDNNFTCAHGNAAYISCPTLAIGRTDGFEFVVAEWIYNRSIAEKKDCAFIEGMTHGGGCNDAEKYGDVVKLENDYIDKWLQETFSL